LPGDATGVQVRITAERRAAGGGGAVTTTGTSVTVATAAELAVRPAPSVTFTLALYVPMPG
jgi:hypothetical protein